MWEAEFNISFQSRGKFSQLLIVGLRPTMRIQVKPARRIQARAAYVRQKPLGQDYVDFSEQ